jgi:hypothetical protein
MLGRCTDNPPDRAPAGPTTAGHPYQDVHLATAAISPQTVMMKATASRARPTSQALKIKFQLGQ